MSYFFRAATKPKDAEIASLKGAVAAAANRGGGRSDGGFSISINFGSGGFGIGGGGGPRAGIEHNGGWGAMRRF